MPTTCEQAVAEYFAALRAMDADRWVNTFASDAVSHDPVGVPPHHGHAALRQFLTGVLSLFQTVGLTEEHIFIAGNSAAVKWNGQGVGRNGRAVTFEGIDVIDCDAEGKIATVRAFWDPGPVIAAVTA
ncbi:MAG: nuclear transport factor 2 family protein [Acidobacteriota bacterium]|nr:nuclear transport factor 2 family protein [Acidobacteriota bacterium]